MMMSKLINQILKIKILAKRQSSRYKAKKRIIKRKQFLTKKIPQSLCVTSSLHDILSGDCPISPWSFFPDRRRGFHYFGTIPPSIPLD
jgi:hypothetical protein